MTSCKRLTADSPLSSRKVPSARERSPQPEWVLYCLLEHKVIQ